VLQAASSRAAGAHVPERSPLQVPLAPQASYVFVATSRPQVPPDASCNPMQCPLSGLHATPCPTSHCSLTEQAAPIAPGTGVKQVAVPFGQTVPALQAP
jgi:hypothetical protein